MHGILLPAPLRTQDLERSSQGSVQHDMLEYSIQGLEGYSYLDICAKYARDFPY